MPKGLTFKTSHVSTMGDFEVWVYRNGQKVGSQGFNVKDKDKAAKFLKQTAEAHS